MKGGKWTQPDIPLPDFRKTSLGKPREAIFDPEGLKGRDADHDEMRMNGPVARFAHLPKFLLSLFFWPAVPQWDNTALALSVGDVARLSDEIAI